MQIKPFPKKLSNLKDRFRGRRAFILGNGPSLTDLDLSHLENEYTFGVNSIFYLFEEIGFKPSFYVVEDTLVAEDRAAEINELDGMVKIFGTYLNYCINDSKNTLWANVLFNYENYSGFPHFSRDASQCLWVGGTVSYVCMQLAYMMGFDPVYLIGFDHSYNIPDDADIEGTIITSTSQDPNHFHPEYFGKGKRWHLPRVDRMQLSYLKAKKVFEQDGRQIVNATAGGMLEVFPRIAYAAIFKDDETRSGKDQKTAGKPSKKAAETPPPDLSVIVCTYNNHVSLVNTLESLYQQSLSPDRYEVLVVDNNSDDQTKAISTSFPRCKYVFEEKQGLAQARNTGIAEATGRIIAFIDDDAEADFEWLSRILAAFEKNENIWAAGGKALPIWDAEKPAWLTETYYRSLSLLDWGENIRPLAWPERIIGTNCAFRKAVFEEIGRFQTDLGRVGSVLLGNEDTEIQERIHETGHQVLYVPDAIVHHHVPADRMTEAYLQKRDEGHRISQQILQLRTEGKEAEAKKMAENYILQQQLKEHEATINRTLPQSNLRLATYKDIHRGQRCVIIGNGPSLNDMDLSFLKNEITFGTNRIYLGFERFGFTPDYYLSINPLVIEQSTEEILAVPAPKFLSLHGIKHIPEDREDVMYLQSVDSPIFSRDPRSGIWEGYTVTYAALQLAYYMGFSEIYLIGCDHSFATTGPANAEITSQGKDPNHFDSSYFGKGTRWHLPDLVNSEMAYGLARMVYEAEGRHVYDATLNGKLKVFPKVDYREFFLDSPPDKEIPAKLQTGETIQGSPILVSALVSTYNDEKLLRACLDDLENQTIADRMEIIVIDSGSEQNEAAIVADFQERYANILYIRTERESLYQAWNRGILKARGRYITNANTDDSHHPEALEKLVAALETHPEADLAYADCQWSARPNDSFNSADTLRDIHYPAFHPALNMLYCPLGPHPVWRRKTFEKIGLFDARFKAAGDYEFLLRFTAAGLNAVHVPELLSVFYQNTSGLTLGANVSEEENMRILNRYRSSTPIQSICRVTPGDKTSEALAWTALGNQAIRYQVPWLDEPVSDPNYAAYCYLKAIETEPIIPALNNLIAVLGAMGNWDQCEALLAQLPPGEMPEMRRTVTQREVLQLLPVDIEPAVQPLSCQVEQPEPAVRPHSSPSSSSAPEGFNVISYASGNLGIGVTARNVIQLLLDHGYPVSILDIDPGFGRGGKDLRFQMHTVPNPEDLPHSINLFILPPGDLSAVLQQAGSRFSMQQRLNAAFSMWELPRLPRDWIPTLEAMDVLIAESAFIEHAFSFNLSGVHTIAADHPLYLPDRIQPNRARFGLPEDGCLFITSFEPFSDPQRKNPMAVVQAFEMAFKQENNTHLILKLNNAQHEGSFHPLVEALQKRCLANPDIHILSETLTYREVLELYASCDSFVSLHRAEGLGLGPMEAMALGKPVIATGWSGNLSYMNHTNACLVGYRLIPVDGTIPAYNRERLGSGAVWADPDPAEAAAWMRRLAENPELRSTIGGKAQQAIRNHHKKAEQALFIEELHAIWRQKQLFTNFQPVSSFHTESSVQKAADLKDASVDIVIPVYGQADLLKRCVNSVLETTEKAHLILVDDCSPDSEIQEVFSTWENNPRVTLARTLQNSGFIGSTRLGAGIGNAPFILFLNSDTEAPEAGWLEALIPEEPDIAVTGAKLLYPPDAPEPFAGTIQHAGVARNNLGVPYHPFIGQPGTIPEASLAKDINAITGACFLVRREVWERLGGWNPAFGRGVYEDVDFCWRARSQGFRVRYKPGAVLYHHESASRSENGRHSLNEHMSANLSTLLESWPGITSDEALFYAPEVISGWRQAEQLLQRAQRELSEGKFQAAVQTMQLAVKAAPNQPEVLIGYAQLLLQQNKHKPALESLYAAVANAPTHWSARFLLMDTLINTHNAAEAWQQSQILLHYFPENEEIKQRRRQILSMDPTLVSPSSTSRAEQLLEKLLQSEDMVALLEEHREELDGTFLSLVQEYVNTAEKQGHFEVAAAMTNLMVYVEQVLASSSSGLEKLNPDQILNYLLDAADPVQALVDTEPFFTDALLDHIEEQAFHSATSGNKGMSAGYHELADYVRDVLQKTNGRGSLPDAEILLQEILAAEDILTVLQKNEHRLTPALLHLVQDNIHEAEAHGMEEVARALEHLETYLQHLLVPAALSAADNAEMTKEED
ncbi:MAG: glycosyltransferase [Anaerolineales bacterium]|nr:glycosyltransferase [Anaerolineales bacterium]